MPLSRELMLERSRARDAAFDGRFLTGVLSTGIYCLPSCPARRPRPENVRFFASEEEARAAGLRPCLRCRPDRFFADRDPEVERAEQLARRVRAAPAEFHDVASLARAAQLGTTRLSALTRRHFHRSPAELLGEARVDRAARELLATGRRVLDVALDAGFESASAFHANFARRTRATPQAWRALARSAAFTLALPRDFRAEEALAAIARDPESASERRAGARCAVALRIDGRPTRLELALEPGRARGEVCAGRALSALEHAQAHARARALLGLEREPLRFERRARRDPALGPLVARRPGARVSRFVDPWEALLWASLGQRVSLAVACARRRALTAQAGEEAGGGLRCTPTPARVADLGAARLAALGLTRAQAAGLEALAGRVAEGALDLERLAAGSAVRAERRLRAQRGVGPWTAQYVLMRGFGLADCAPAGDSALATALQAAHGLAARPDPDRVRALLAPHAPDRSLATWHCWRSLEDRA